MRTHAFRLHRGDDLRMAIEQYACEHNIRAAVILSCVGCVYKARLRDASGVNIRSLDGHYEIVSATGTVSRDRTHIHISLAGEDLVVIGGHLAEGCIVNTTAEIVLLEMNDVTFSGEFDPQTGYTELCITPAEHHQ